MATIFTYSHTFTTNASTLSANVNCIAEDNFQRVRLIEAYYDLIYFYYDLISICELVSIIQLNYPRYYLTFVPYKTPTNTRHGGDGPIMIRNDFSGYEPANFSRGSKASSSEDSASMGDRSGRLNFHKS